MMSSNPSSNANGSGGEWGKGAGKGGGSGGSIREAGGSFEKSYMLEARKEIYVRKTQIQELAKLVESHEILLSQYRGLIQHHKDAIDMLESHIQELESQEAMKDKDSTQE